MVWEWRLLRCFEDFAETFEERGWETGPRYGDMPALVAWNGDYCILFDSWDDATGECWFELADRDRRRTMLVKEIPTPGQASKLLAERNLLAR
ncbi:MAG: hypothetical protein WA990_01865 [Rubrobacteraceae bacterium]